MVAGLPDTVRACLFDLDGVLTQTATLHAAAWKQMFDAFLQYQASREGSSDREQEDFIPFTQSDYAIYVDGKPRVDGTRSFLASRGIALPEGAVADPPTALTVHGLGNRKNELVGQLLTADNIELFEGSLRYVHAVRDADLSVAVVSSSANAAQVLAAAGIADLFDARIDGVIAAQRNLPGKPAPDMFLAGAAALNVTPAHAAVFEDALAGVQAGRAGNFAWVVGVDRVGYTDSRRAQARSSAKPNALRADSQRAQALLEAGADIIVSDLAELLDR